MDYSLGLDIGTTSIGFAIVDMDNGKIIESNSIIFEEKETEPHKNKTLIRRQSRAKRRLIKRRRQRKYNLRKLLFRYGFVCKDFVNNPKEYIKNNPVDNLFYLRYKAAKELISDYELSRILYSFGSRRGYSDRYDIDTGEKDKAKEKGAIKQSINTNQDILKQYNTFGEMMWSLHPEKCRNSNDDYSQLATMQDIKKEIKYILQKQKSLGNKKINDAFINEILSEKHYQDDSVSLFYQRPLKEISKQVGLCAYQHHKGYKRASKATYTFLEYIFLEKLHNTKIYYRDKECSLFSVINDFEVALEKFIKKDGKYNITFIKSLFNKKDLKNITIKLDKNDEKENKILGKDACLLINTIKEFDKDLSIDNIDEIATVLSIYQDKEQKAQQLNKLSISLSPAEISKLSELDFKGFGKLSIETMRSMIPLMKNGSTPYEAKKECGFTLITNTQNINFLPPLNCDERYIKEVLTKKVPSLDVENFIPFYDAIGNPVVNRVVSVLRKVINQIIKDYGVPEQIIIEMAKGYNSKKEKQHINKIQRQLEKQKEQIEKELKEKDIKGNDKNIRRYQYWKEQNGYCLYSGKPISFADLFSKKIETEHVLPQSKVFIDSQKNKIVVFAKENQNKSNSYHYDYLKREGRWDNFVEMVKKLEEEGKMPSNKAEWLLSEDFSNVTKESYMNDTRYATRLIRSYLEYYLYPASDIHRTGFRRQVFTINGKATAFFRKHWGLQKEDEKKNRDNHYHHAIDAIVLASITPKMINDISTFFRAKEQGKKVSFPMPYSNFRKDIFNLVDKYKNNQKFVHHIQKIRKNVNAYKEKPISTIVVNGKEFEKNKKTIFDFAKDIQKEFNSSKNQLALDLVIEKEITKIVDNSTDKFIINNIGDRIKKILSLESKVKRLEADKEKIKNNQDEIEKVNNNQDKIEKINNIIKKLKNKINAPFIIYRGKKKTPQVVKSFQVIGKAAGKYNNVSNKRDSTIQKRKNDETIGMEIWQKDNKKYCVPLYLHDLWNKNDKKSKTGTKIDNSFKKILTMHSNTVLKIEKNNVIDYILYRGVGGNRENIEYKPINKKVEQQLYISINTLSNIELKNIDIYGNVLDK